MGYPNGDPFQAFFQGVLSTDDQTLRLFSIFFLRFFPKKISKMAKLCKNVAFLTNFENFYTGFETFFKGNETFFKNQSMFLRLFSNELRLFSKIRPLRKILEKGLTKAQTISDHLDLHQFVIVQLTRLVDFLKL